MTYVEHRSRVVAAPAPVLWQVVAGFGGPSRWGSFSPLWDLRATADRLIGGPGLRGAPAGEPRAGDAIHFWRVEDVVPGERLRLHAEMRQVPGTARLTLSALPLAHDSSVLEQEVVFEPRGVIGHAFWWAEWAPHVVVFRTMLTGLAHQAERRHHGSDAA
jgi:hypothetical protein